MHKSAEISVDVNTL